jgi:hypothetical protein
MGSGMADFGLRDGTRLIEWYARNAMANYRALLERTILRDLAATE